MTRPIFGGATAQIGILFSLLKEGFFAKVHFVALQNPLLLEHRARQVCSFTYFGYNQTPLHLQIVCKSNASTRVTN